MTDPELPEIEDAVPLPPANSSRIKYPFDDLAPGASFFVAAVIGEGDTESSACNRLQSVLHSCARAAVKRTGSRFTTRRWSEAGEPGIRVWRIEDEPAQP